MTVKHEPMYQLAKLSINSPFSTKLYLIDRPSLILITVLLGSNLTQNK